MTVPKEFEQDLIEMGYLKDPKPRRIEIKPEPPMQAYMREQISIRSAVAAFFFVAAMMGLTCFALNNATVQEPPQWDAR